MLRCAVQQQVALHTVQYHIHSKFPTVQELCELHSEFEPIQLSDGVRNDNRISDNGDDRDYRNDGNDRDDGDNRDHSDLGQMYGSE